MKNLTEASIKEALQIQPLTEEEKSQRHILGRLYGPIATCKEGTRNGRTYNRELWEKALNDEVFQEKIAHKSLFLEFSHPIDREETDPLKACACIPEMPKIIDGDLYAYVDILDTPSGRILKTLVDYGFEPGISSRGSGDILDNDEVDPETFYLETWDIVQLPAVKKARLSVCESLNTSKVKNTSKTTENLKQALKTVLNESLKEEKLNTDEQKELAASIERELGENPLESDYIEDSNEATLEKVTQVQAFSDKEINTLQDLKVFLDNSQLNDEASIKIVAKLNDQVFDQPAVNVTQETNAETNETAIIINIDCADYAESDSDDIEKSQLETNNVIAKERDSDKDKSVEDFEDLAIIEKLAAITKEKTQLEEQLLSLRETLNVRDLKNENLNDQISYYSTLLKEVKTKLETSETKLSESLDKIKTLEMQDKLVKDKNHRNLKQITSLEERLERTIKKNNQLKLSNKNLVNEASVNSDTVETLQTKLAESLKKLSEERLTNLKITRKNENLTKKLALQDSLTNKNTDTLAKLDARNKKLAESLQLKEDSTKKELAKVAQLKLENKRLTENLQNTLNSYINLRANLLGVSPQTISTKLTENFTPEDVDSICDSIMDDSSAVNSNRWALPSGNTVKVAIHENANTTNSREDDLTDLYQLAGLLD